MRSERLGKRTRALLANPDNELRLSTASAWEAVIKAGLGKLEVVGDPATFLRTRLAKQQIVPLPIAFEHVLGVNALPDIHRDPFDRLIVAQALYEDMPLVTADIALKAYGVVILDAAR